MLERTDAVNWSTLEHIDTSPKLYRYRLDTPRSDTDALKLGRVTHTALYEPDKLDSRYVIEPRFHRGMKDETARDKGYDGGREAAAEFDEQVATLGAEVVELDFYSCAIRMRDALLEDPVSGPMIVGGYAEQPIQWVDETTGIECRGRIDHINGQLSDLKTAESVVLRRSNAAVARYQYHGQLAFYYDGLLANGVQMSGPPALIAVESKEPHDVVVLEFSDDDIEAGRLLYEFCLRRLAACRAANEWPGVASGRRQPLALPAWSKPETEEITMGGEGIF